MATLTDIVNLTVSQTRRPEINAVTEAAVRSATLRAHHVDFFPRDLTSHILQATPNSPGVVNIQNISSLLTRLRSVKSVRILDPNLIPAIQLEYRDLDDLYTRDGNHRPHVYTLLGDTLRLFSHSTQNHIEIFFYQNPNLTGLQYSSWIATLYPDEIAAWAATIVFARTGFAEMANQFNQLYVVPFQQLLVASHLLGNVS